MELVRIPGNEGHVAVQGDGNRDDLTDDLWVNTDHILALSLTDGSGVWSDLDGRVGIGLTNGSFIVLHEDWDLESAVDVLAEDNP